MDKHKPADVTDLPTDETPFQNQRLSDGQGVVENLQCLAADPEAAWRAFGPDWAQAVANSAIDALTQQAEPAGNTK